MVFITLHHTKLYATCESTLVHPGAELLILRPSGMSAESFVTHGFPSNFRCTCAASMHWTRPCLASCLIGEYLFSVCVCVCVCEQTGICDGCCERMDAGLKVPIHSAISIILCYSSMITAVQDGCIYLQLDVCALEALQVCYDTNLWTCFEPGA
jgi:hypothetical protein